MKHMIIRLFTILGAFALVASVSTTAFAQESEDAMDDFMNSPADGAPPVSEDLPEDKAAVIESSPKKAPKAAAKSGGKAAAPGADPAPPGDVVDMRLNAPTQAVAAPIQSSPALDKIEALMIAEAEMKVFMKSGGLRSRKIK